MEYFFLERPYPKSFIFHAAASVLTKTNKIYLRFNTLA